MTPFIPLWLIQLQLSNNRNIIILIWCGQYSSGSILNCPSPLTFCRNGQSIIEDEPPNNAIKCMRYKLKFSSLPLSIEYTQRKKGTVNVLHALPFDNEPFFWSNERKKKQYETTSFESMPAVASLLSLSVSFLGNHDMQKKRNYWPKNVGPPLTTIYLHRWTTMTLHFNFNWTIFCQMH